MKMTDEEIRALEEIDSSNFHRMLREERELRDIERQMYDDDPEPWSDQCEF